MALDEHALVQDHAQHPAHLPRPPRLGLAAAVGEEDERDPLRLQVEEDLAGAVDRVAAANEHAVDALSAASVLPQGHTCRRLLECKGERGELCRRLGLQPATWGRGRPVRCGAERGARGVASYGERKNTSGKPFGWMGRAVWNGRLAALPKDFYEAVSRQSHIRRDGSSQLI